MLRASLFALFFCTPALAQTTWHVDVNGIAPGTGTSGDPYASLQFALDAASTVSGDTLLVAPGVYEEKVNNKDKNVLVQSTGGPLLTTIRMPTNSTGFTVTLRHLFFDGSTPVMDGFTIAGTAGASSDGVHLEQQAQLLNSVVSGHRKNGGSGAEGRGVLGSVNGATVRQCTIIDNDIGAIDDNHFGDLTLHNTVLAGNGLDLEVDGSGLFAHHSAWTTFIGGVFGGNNLVVDPGLWNPMQGDPRLAPASVCIDSGDPALPLDPDGTPADRGAIPFDQNYLPPATVYCTGKLNSGGCEAQISLKGGSAASLSSNVPLRVEATSVLPGVLGLLFFGTSGRRGVPFMGGFHCAIPPITRTGAQASGNAGPTACPGVFSFDFNAYLKTPAGSLQDAGAMVQAQYWYRDPADPFGSATSNAVEFPIGL